MMCRRFSLAASRWTRAAPGVLDSLISLGKVERRIKDSKGFLTFREGAPGLYDVKFEALGDRDNGKVRVMVTITGQSGGKTIVARGQSVQEWRGGRLVLHRAANRRVPARPIVGHRHEQRHAPTRARASRCSTSRPTERPTQLRRPKSNASLISRPRCGAMRRYFAATKASAMADLEPPQPAAGARASARATTKRPIKTTTKTSRKSKSSKKSEKSKKSAPEPRSTRAVPHRATVSSATRAGVRGAMMHHATTRHALRAGAARRRRRVISRTKRRFSCPLIPTTRAQRRPTRRRPMRARAAFPTWISPTEAATTTDGAASPARLVFPVRILFPAVTLIRSRSIPRRATTATARVRALTTPWP